MTRGDGHTIVRCQYYRRIQGYQLPSTQREHLPPRVLRPKPRSAIVLGDDSRRHTDGDGLDLDPRFKMRHLWVDRRRMIKHIRLAERVHKRCTTRSGRAFTNQFPISKSCGMGKGHDVPTTITVN
jgi:hypothetical protein